jgi:hypothetical protein
MKSDNAASFDHIDHEEDMYVVLIYKRNILIHAQYFGSYGSAFKYAASSISDNQIDIALPDGEVHNIYS